MARLVRALRTSRRRVRLGNVNVSNLTNGSLVDIDNPATLRDLRANERNVLLLPARGGAGLDNLDITEANTNLTALTAGNIRYVGVELPVGTKIASVTFAAGATGAGTPTNQWAALFSSNSQVTPTTLTVVAVSPDALTAAWAANTNKTFTFNTPYTVPVSGYYYVGLLVAATTAPTLMGVPTAVNLQSLTSGPAKKSVLETGQTRTTPLALAATVTTTFSGTAADANVPFVRLA